LGTGVAGVWSERTAPAVNASFDGCWFGDRRLQVLLECEGWQVNHKHVYRLYMDCR